MLHNVSATFSAISSMDLCTELGSSLMTAKTLKITKCVQWQQFLKMQYYWFDLSCGVIFILKIQ